MRDYLNYKYKKVYAEQSRIPHIKFVLKLYLNRDLLSKNLIISKCSSSAHFNSKLTIEKTIRMMDYYGLIEKKEKNFKITENGLLAKYTLKNNTENEFLEVLNYSSYLNNNTYHLIIDLLFNIAEMELSRSSDFFSQMSIEEQYTYIQDKIEESLKQTLHKRYIMYYTHFIREMGIINKFGYVPQFRNNIWRSIFLISFSDVLKVHFTLNKDVLLIDDMLQEIRAPLFISKELFYAMLTREILHPYFKLTKAKGNEYYIKINKFVSPKTIIEENQ